MTSLSTNPVTPAAAAHLGINLFSPANPAPLDFSVLKEGYLGTIESPTDLLSEAKKIADLRREAAVVGGYAVRSFQRTEEIKGVLGELFVRKLYRSAAADGRVSFSELVLDRPDTRPDLVVNVPAELVDLIDCDLVDVKGTCDRFQGIAQFWDDKHLLVSERDMDGYIEDGLTGLLFVHAVSPTVAHVAYYRLQTIRGGNGWTLSPKGEKVTPKYPGYVRAMSGVIPGK